MGACFLPENTNPRESVTVKLFYPGRNRTDKSDTWKRAVFLPEPEITFVYGGGLCIAGLPFLMTCLSVRHVVFYLSEA